MIFQQRNDGEFWGIFEDDIHPSKKDPSYSTIPLFS